MLSATALSIARQCMFTCMKGMAVSTSAHACLQIVFAEKRLPLLAGVLRALIWMDHDLLLWLAPPNSTQQILQGKGAPSSSATSLTA